MITRDKQMFIVLAEQFPASCSHTVGSDGPHSWWRQVQSVERKLFFFLGMSSTVFGCYLLQRLVKRQPDFNFSPLRVVRNVTPSMCLTLRVLVSIWRIKEIKKQRRHIVGLFADLPDVVWPYLAHCFPMTGSWPSGGSQEILRWCICTIYQKDMCFDMPQCYHA